MYVLCRSLDVAVLILRMTVSVLCLLSVLSIMDHYRSSSFKRAILELVLIDLSRLPSFTGVI